MNGKATPLAKDLIHIQKFSIDLSMKVLFKNKKQNIK